MVGEGADADVVVVGAGAGGVAAALTLHRLGAKVVIVDRAAHRPILGESLPPAADGMLCDMGVQTALVGCGHLPVYGNRSMWGSDTPAETDFIHQPSGRGWRLDRAAFDAQLE